MSAKIIAHGAIKTVSALLTAALVIICLFFGWLYVCNLSGMDVPKLGPLRIYVVLSDSMAPFLQVNDAIIISETPAENLREGDIITFYAFESNTVITHRITSAAQSNGGYEFMTKGDNNNVGDSFVTPDSKVIGRYIFKISGFGSLLEMLTAKPYFLAIVVVFVIAVQFLLTLGANLTSSSDKTVEKSPDGVSLPDADSSDDSNDSHSNDDDDADGDYKSP